MARHRRPPHPEEGEMTAEPQPAVPVPAGANADGDGIVVGGGPVTVDAYIDFLCPFCRMFEERTGPTLRSMLDDGLINLVYHPMGFLDDLSTDRYSSRASSASGCASDRGRFYEYAQALFANQPPEGGPGLSDEELVRLGAAVGIQDGAFPGCVLGHMYLLWTRYVTERAVARGISGTPSVFVEGVGVPANPLTIAAAVASVVR
jgi:protein-disulfide isomerase